jgi:hypothetical protein
VSKASPYFRSFVTSTVFFGLAGIRMVSRHPDQWSKYHVMILVVAWVLTGLLLGVVGTRFEKLRSWWRIAIGTIPVAFAVLGVMLFTVERIYGPPRPAKFDTANEMMVFAAGEATKWVKKDRGIDLDYSLESTRIIEEELDRISKNVNKTNPPQGTFGLAMAYGAYVGEVFRRRDGGSWAIDDPKGGAKTYPLTTRSNTVIFPVSWCWKRLINGEEDNVYSKAMLFNDMPGEITNGITPPLPRSSAPSN